MLVLSREQNEKIVFPNLGITVEILRIARKRVRIGIDAPPHIDVVRQEIQPQGHVTDAYRKWQHDVRNRLHGATMGLHVAQKQLQSGQVVESEATLEIALRELELLNQELPGAAKSGPVEGCTATAPRRALLVEDDRNESALLAEYLRICGYEVDTAEDGLEAMRVLGGPPAPGHRSAGHAYAEAGRSQDSLVDPGKSRVPRIEVVCSQRVQRRVGCDDRPARRGSLVHQAHQPPRTREGYRAGIPERSRSRLIWSRSLRRSGRMEPRTGVMPLGAARYFVKGLGQAPATSTGACPFGGLAPLHRTHTTAGSSLPRTRSLAEDL